MEAADMSQAHWFIEVAQDTLFSRIWWVEQGVTHLVFSVLLAYLASLFTLRRQRKKESAEREPFEGWHLHVIGYPDYEPQRIDWQEVRRFRNSDFELWKFAKSVVSGACNVTPLTAGPARRAEWLRVNDPGKIITVDFTRIPQDHVASFYETAKVPEGWERIPAPEGRPDKTVVVRKDREGRSA